MTRLKYKNHFNSKVLFISWLMTLTQICIIWYKHQVRPISKTIIYDTLWRSSRNVWWQNHELTGCLFQHNWHKRSPPLTQNVSIHKVPPSPLLNSFVPFPPLSLSLSLSSLSFSYHLSLPLSLLSHSLSLFLSFDAGTDLDMKKGAWQTRGRSCRQVTSPKSKQASVRKPYKKPRQVTVTRGR